MARWTREILMVISSAASPDLSPVKLAVSRSSKLYQVKLKVRIEPVSMDG